MTNEKSDVFMDVPMDESSLFNVPNQTNQWGIRRRTRSAGNLARLRDETDESSSGEPESLSCSISRPKPGQKNHSDSDDNMELQECPGSSVDKCANVAGGSRNSNPNANRSNPFRLKTFANDDNLYDWSRFHAKRTLRIFPAPESDSYNENFPSRPSIRRKRKLKRMCIDQPTNVLSNNGKRKRAQPQRGHGYALESCSSKFESKRASVVHSKPLIQNVIDKFKKLDTTGICVDGVEELSYDTCETVSESSVSFSGSEGHDGDDELTDWAPDLISGNNRTRASDVSSWVMDESSREMRAGCRRVYEERPGFRVNSAINERIARFVQNRDKKRLVLKVSNKATEAVCRLAELYLLEVVLVEPNVIYLDKTSNTPFMLRAPYKHSGSFGSSSGYKKICRQKTRTPHSGSDF